MSGLTPAQREALISAMQSVRGDVRDRVVQYAETMWDTLGDWRDDDIDRFIAAVVPRIEAGKLTIAKATDTYIAAMIDADPVGAIDLAQIRNGADPSDVYRRPAVAMRSDLASGASFADALATGARRLESLVATDLELAHTHQARATMTRKGRRRGGKVQAFRRVPTGKENCALCLIASTQRYWVGDLMPIHPGCDCGVAPLGPGEHVSQVIDPDMLEDVHDQVRGLTGYADRTGRDEIDYRELVIVREHGEYGPTLTWADHRHTGPSLTPKATGADATPATPEPRRSWVYDAILSNDPREWDSHDLNDWLDEATREGDEMALDIIRKEWDRRDRERSGYRGTGFTRAQLRTMYAEHVDMEYWAAERESNGFLLNEAGRAAGVDPKSLFTGTEARALKYASDELKWYWSEHPRLSFDAYVGDKDAAARAGRVDF